MSRKFFYLIAVVAAVSREWGLDATQSQWINTANVAGLFFGALASGWLADRFGRDQVRAEVLKHCGEPDTETA